MSYEVEHLSQIRNRVLKNLDTIDIPFSFKGLLGSSLSGLSYMLHGHINYLSSNMIPDTAKGDVLERWADFFGVIKKQAQPAKVILQIRGKNRSEIPKEWVINGNDFRAKTTEFIDESGNGQIICYGIAPNTFETESFATIKNASSYLETKAIILSKTNETEVETDDSLRFRLKKSINKPTQGGSVFDYVSWMRSIPGVVEAWVKPWHLIENGKPGHVQVTWLEENLKQSETTKQDIENFLNSNAPATACIKVNYVKEKIIPLNIKPVPNTKEVKEEIEKSVNKFILSQSKPGGYLDENYKKTPNFISISQLSAAISAVPQEESHTITNIKEDIPVENEELIKCFVTFS